MFDSLTSLQKIVIGLGLLAIILGGAVLTKNYLFEETKVEILEASGSGLVKGLVAEKKELVVDVSGAVITPGVYRLPDQSRVGDALSVAGGLSAQADRLWVAKNINLAGKLTDGAKIYVPEVGTTMTSGAGGSAANKVEGSGSSVTDLININLATAGELDTLPGIGPVTANKIISNKPYQSVEELMSKKVVSQKVFDQIKDKVSVY